MFKDIGFMIPKISNTKQHDIILRTIRDFIDNNPSNQYVLFNSFYDKIETYSIPILHLSHAKLFHGDLMVFDHISLVISSRFPNISNLYYYAQNLPWLESRQSLYRDWKKIFTLDHLNIISSNQYIDDIYSICWKKTKGISEKFSYDEIKQII